MTNHNVSEIYISYSEALALEIKLNKSKYDKEWRELGDILYKWRINPECYQQRAQLNI